MASPYCHGDEWSPVWYSLCVHLCFAVPTPLLWIYVIVSALRRFPSPPRRASTAVRTSSGPAWPVAASV